MTCLWVHEWCSITRSFCLSTCHHMPQNLRVCQTNARPRSQESEEDVLQPDDQAAYLSNKKGMSGVGVAEFGRSFHTFLTSSNLRASYVETTECAYLRVEALPKLGFETGRCIEISTFRKSVLQLHGVLRERIRARI